jgi:PAS domain S-box-containing protein
MKPPGDERRRHEVVDTLVARLPADPRSVRDARHAVRSAVEAVGRTDAGDGWAELAELAEWAERAELAVSELVTNAIVHAGTDIELRVLLVQGSLRVEVDDGAAAMPAPRSHSATAATGRGLQLVASSVDRWDVQERPGGKTVWFEIGAPQDGVEHPATSPRPEAVEVVLRGVPLLLHRAWQEHAAALLREYLLVHLDDDPHVLEQHAEASGAMALLYEQLPVPDLPDDPEALMAGAVEPGVTADAVRVQVPPAAVGHFTTLDLLLRRARELASRGDLLGPTTQPEAAEMRAWLCREVRRQADGAAPATWSWDLGPGPLLRDAAGIAPALRRLAGTDDAVLATDADSMVVAVSPAAVALLGYAEEGELLGRRVTVVIPARFHQAHLAGTTLHHTNGRSVLLGVPLTVPVVRADGTEAVVAMTVEARLLDDDLQAFVATFP